MPRILQRAQSVLLAALLAPIAISLTPSTVTAAESLPPSTLGMRASGGFPDAGRIAQIERELDQPLNWYVAFADRTSPAKMRSSVQGQVKPGSVFADRPDSINVVMTMPLAFGTGTAKTAGGRESIRRRLVETANGKWDDDFRAAARSLIAGGHGNAVLRLGHEFTGSWYPWSSQQNEPAYIAAYRHIHDVMESESSAFRFEWNAARNTFREWGPPAYPGDDYVDIISLDVYYEPWKGDPAPLTDDIWQRRYINVMAAHRDFAAEHGKQVAYTEWANGEIDQPQFIERMHAWFVSLPAAGGGSLAYHSYFNASNNKYNLNKYPQSKAAYLRLFGRDGSTPPTDPTPPTPPPTTPPTTSAPDLPSIDLASTLEVTTGEEYTVPATIQGDKIRWWKVSGPGIVWGDKSIEQPTVKFTSDGTYVLRVKALNNDGASVVQSVTVQAGSAAPPATDPPATAPPATAPPATAPPATSPPATTAPGPNSSVKVSVRDASVAEGQALVFKFALDEPAKQDVVVDFAVSNVSTSDDDYRSPRDTTVIIPKGSKRIFVGIATVGDKKAEPAEVLRVSITSAQGASIDDGSATGTITRP